MVNAVAVIDLGSSGYRCSFESNRSTICKHKPIHEIESKLYPDYDDGLYQRMYIELQEEFE